MAAIFKKVEHIIDQQYQAEQEFLKEYQLDHRRPDRMAGGYAEILL